MKLKLPVVALGIVLAIAVGGALGLLITSYSTLQIESKKMEGETSAPPVVSTKPTTAPKPSGKLSVRKASSDVSSLDLEVVYTDNKPVTNVLGFSLTLTVTPVNFAVGSSTISPSELFTKTDYTFPFRSVKRAEKNKDSVEAIIGAARINPSARINLASGSVIATLSLASPKKGTYSVDLVATDSKVMNGENNNVVGEATGGSFTVL